MTLPPKTQVVLLDFIRHLDRYTEFGQYPAPPNGIPYGFGHCAIIMHRNTFAAAMIRLEERGFLESTGQMNLDGEATYYTVDVKWRRWKTEGKDRARVDRLKARITRRETLDTHATCTIKVHPPAQKLDNPLLKFWARHPQYAPEKRASLPIRSEENIREHAHTPEPQEVDQTEIDNLVANGEEFRAKLRHRLAERDAQPKPTTREDRRL